MAGFIMASATQMVYCHQSTCGGRQRVGNTSMWVEILLSPHRSVLGVVVGAGSSTSGTR